MDKDQIRRRAALQGAVHAAAWAVHGVTGRTDQTLQEVVDANPDHAAVKAWQRAKDELEVHVREERGQ